MRYFTKIRFSILSILLFSCILGNGQTGHYVSISGIGQFTKLSNSDDFATRTRGIIPRDTYNPGFGLRYTNNFDQKFGFETGLLYSRVGQKYEGEVDSGFSGYLNATNYESEVQMQYLKVPVLFRFNSTLDADETAYLSIGFGFGIDILLDVNAQTTPAPSVPNELSINYRELYKNVTGSFMADAIFNFKLSDDWFLKSGIIVNFGISDIEEKGYDFPEDAPSTWHFPLSTVKESQPDMEARDRTRHSIFGIELGVAYRFGKNN